MDKFFRVPFAQSGDRVTVPDAVDPSGNVSFTQGYGLDYQRPKTDPLSKNIERDKMNSLFYQFTKAISEIQSQGVPDWISSALNGGSPYSYANRAVVRYTDGFLYMSLATANVALPTDATKWVRYDGIIADNANPLDTYTALRAYTGPAINARIRGVGIAGEFWRDPSDTTSADNGGTVIVDALTRRWKRLFTDRQEASWYGIVSDGTTDQTTQLVAVLTTLGAGNYRGWFFVPYNTKFSVPTVYAAVPVGVVLDDESSINWGQPPTYKNKFRIMHSGDVVNDDTQLVVSSPHHPAFMTMNTHTAGSSAASEYLGTWLHSIGQDSQGDPMLTMITQKRKDPSANRWMIGWRLQTPYLVATANPRNWTGPGHVYAANSYVLSDGGKVYTTIAGGTSGSTAPTGTGTGINDGGVLWNFVQAALNIDSTRMMIDEDGNFQHFAPATKKARLTQNAGASSHHFETDDAAAEIVWRDAIRSLDLYRVNAAIGMRQGTALSLNRVAMTGAAPSAPLTGAGRVANGGATNMTSMPRPVGRTNMIVELRFDDGNTTLVHSLALADQFKLKGNANVNPPSGSFMRFELDTTFSSVWIEVSRSF